MFLIIMFEDKILNITVQINVLIDLGFDVAWNIAITWPQ